MRVSVDPEKCQGTIAATRSRPSSSTFDEYGNAHELHDGKVPAELEDKARMAAANCPEYAISISE